jgi:hypothetical protein
LVEPQRQKKAKEEYKKHAQLGKVRATVLRATSLQTSQVEVPDGLSIRIGVQGRTTRSCSGNGVTKAVE